MNNRWLVLVACLAALAEPQTRAVDGWSRDCGWRADVQVAADAVTSPRMPFSVEMDFVALLRSAGAVGAFAPWSVQVTRVEDDETETMVPHLMSEDFTWKTTGTVSWVIVKPGQLHYRIYFDVQEHGPYAPPERMPLVGIGDNFRYNRPDGVDPLQCMEAGVPLSADLDGDGKVDLVRPTSWSSTWGQPWFTVWFWRNVGTNEHPVYADFVRLCADGKPIDDHYSGCALYDWNGDGRLDVVTSGKVYRNTGNITPMGAPTFTELCGMPELSVKGEPYRFLIGIMDHDGDGVSDAFYMFSSVHYVYEGPPARNFIKGALYRKINSAAPGRPPVFDKEEPVLRDGEIWTEGCVATGFCDVNRDGILDLVGNSHPLDRIPSIPQYVWWPNTAAKGAPPVYGKASLIPNGQNSSAYAILQVDNAAYHGLFAEDGYRVKYCEFTGQDLPGQMPGYDDRGILMQRNGRCAVQGFGGVDVADWEGNGTWDILSGDEFGFIWLIKNVGTNDEPVFAPAEQVRANSAPIHVQRWHFVQDGNPEYYLGQTKPRYADWDGDGDFDIIAGNNTNRLLWFENVGTRTAPFFTRGEVIRVGDDEAAFAWRCQPSVVDWNADGMTDLVTANKDGQLCLFEHYGDEGKIKLRPGKPLLNEAGQPFIAANPEVCDWDGDGDWDLIGQVGRFGEGGPAFFDNVGTNAESRFKEPARLKCWGTQITLCAHEHSFAAADWYGTGKLDLVCGAESGWFFFFRRPALDSAAPPAVQGTNQLETKP